MKVILQDNQHWVLRFDKSEEVVKGLLDFMLAQNIQACSLSGLGSAYEIELGYYNPHLKDYRKKPFLQELEIVSLVGNGSMLDGKPCLHIHGVFGKNDFSLLGGHVFKIITLATCEIHLVKLEGQMGRRLDPETNLNLLV